MFQSFVMSVKIITTDDGVAFWVVHGFVSHAVSLQGQRLVSVADVPVRELFGLDLACSHCHAILMLCLLLLKDRIHDTTHQRGRVARGDELSVVMALCFVHVLIIGAVRGSAKTM